MLIATFDATAFNFMARFVCNSSIDEVWPLICSVVPAGRTTEITALARHVIFRARRSSWSDLIRLELCSDPNVDGSIIRITAAPPCQTQVVRRVLLVVAIGLMVGLFLAMITNHRGLAAVLCFLLIGTLVPYVSLVQHLFSQARRTSKVVVDRIQEHIRLRQVEPFDVRISPIEFYVLTPVLLLASAAV